MFKFYFLAVPLLTLALPVYGEEPIPPPEEVGSLMSVYMCQQMIETGSLDGQGKEYYGRFAEALLERYGKTQTDLVGQKMTQAFDLPPAEAAQDPYIQGIFRAVFQNILDDDTCFEAFLANEVLP